MQREDKNLKKKMQAGHWPGHTSIPWFVLWQLRGVGARQVPANLMHKHYRLESFLCDMENRQATTKSKSADTAKNTQHCSNHAETIYGRHMLCLFGSWTQTHVRFASGDVATPPWMCMKNALVETRNMRYVAAL